MVIQSENGASRHKTLRQPQYSKIRQLNGENTHIHHLFLSYTLIYIVSHLIFRL